MIEDIKSLYKEKESEYSDELTERYIDYTTNVSDTIMPASMRCCVFLICMYEVLQPERVLDLGSGFSSYALRYFKDKFSWNTEIYSIDNYDWWLGKTIDFCTQNEVDTNHFYIWKQIKDMEIPFELIFVDIEFRERRLKYFDPVYKRFLADKTFMLLDDMHMAVLRTKARSMENRYIKHTVVHETIVEQRYSWLLEIEGGSE